MLNNSIFTVPSIGCPEGSDGMVYGGIPFCTIRKLTINLPHELGGGVDQLIKLITVFVLLLF
jgi:hypothetical protein